MLKVVAASGGIPRLSGLVGLYWASDIGAANGSTVSSWSPNSGSMSALGGAGNKPTYATTGIGGKPSVHFTRASSQSLSAAISGPTKVWSVLSVLKLGSPSSTHIPVALSTAVDVSYSPATISSQWYSRFDFVTTGAASYAKGGTTDSNPHLITSMVNVRSGSFQVDGSTVGTTTIDADASTPTTLILGGASSWFFDGDIALVAVLSGVVTSDPQWPAFKAWVAAYYGMVIA